MSGFQYLLDANIVSHLMRHPDGGVRRSIESVGSGALCTSVIVAAEIHFGLSRNSSIRLKRQADIILGSLDILPFEPPADEIYARIRADLQARGKTIGGNDLFIAAHALALDLTLVTANEREFRRVEGLRVENWLSG